MGEHHATGRCRWTSSLHCQHSYDCCCGSTFWRALQRGQVTAHIPSGGGGSPGAARIAATTPITGKRSPSRKKPPPSRFLRPATEPAMNAESTPVTIHTSNRTPVTSDAVSMPPILILQPLRAVPRRTAPGHYMTNIFWTIALRMVLLVTDGVRSDFPPQRAVVQHKRNDPERRSLGVVLVSSYPEIKSSGPCSRRPSEHVHVRSALPAEDGMFSLSSAGVCVGVLRGLRCGCAAGWPCKAVWIGLCCRAVVG